MTQGWKITLALSAIALLAAFLAPQLKAATQTPSATAESQIEACVRLGPYECCYDPEKP